MTPLGRTSRTAAACAAILSCTTAATVLTIPVAHARDFDGSDQRDSIVATPGDDNVNAGEGHDRVATLGGSDYVDAGKGNDIADGGPGTDTLVGRQGRDRLSGGPGQDVMSAGVGHDVLRGGQGADLLFTWVGHDRVFAGDGDDIAYLPSDGDVDTVDCGLGFDTLVYNAEPDHADTLIDCEAIERSDGPIVNNRTWFDGDSGYLIREVTVGQQFTDGFSVLDLRGTESATIERVALIGNRGFKHVGTMIIGPGREYGARDIVFHWPPTSEDMGGGEVVEAVGASITPRRENNMRWELLVGMEPTKFGRNVRAGLAISYTVNGVRYHHEEYGKVVACALSPEGEKPRGCGYWD